MGFLKLNLLPYGEDEIKRDYDKKELQTQYRIINSHNMKNHILYSDLP